MDIGIRAFVGVGAMEVVGKSVDRIYEGLTTVTVLVGCHVGLWVCCLDVCLGGWMKECRRHRGAGAGETLPRDGGEQLLDLLECCAGLPSQLHKPRVSCARDRTIHTRTGDVLPWGNFLGGG
jgi:hypothetical protein